MNKKPEIIVFAGPNGSGKTTISKMANIIEPLINADDIQKQTLSTNIDAAKLAEKYRNALIDNGLSFTFETVLSTDRNLHLLERAKELGYFIRGIYVLTADVNINVCRIATRVSVGGHDVPRDKIVSRYSKALALIPEFLQICDICHIYDNSEIPFRIYKKGLNSHQIWGNELWSEEQIRTLVGVNKLN
ncbi:MAG: zeta toxin family protein [Anaerovoracaceae bacterium]